MEYKLEYGIIKTNTNSGYLDLPKIIIHPDEYIIGNVEPSENEIIYQLYEITFLVDSDRVEFDFQSEFAVLYINIGSQRPTIKNAHFKLMHQGRNTILSLDKSSILKKAEEMKIEIPIKNSLQDLTLVIGISNNKTNSVDKEFFH